MALGKAKGVPLLTAALATTTALTSPVAAIGQHSAKQTHQTSHHQTNTPYYSPQAQETALKYSIEFGLQIKDPEVQWVLHNSEKYQELVRSKNELCNDNDLPPDRFLVRITSSSKPNAYNERLPFFSEKDARQNTVIHVDPYFFQPPYNEDDRRGIISHEIAHTVGGPNAQQLGQKVIHNFSGHFNWFGKPAAEQFKESALATMRDEETRADYWGSIFNKGDINPLLDLFAKFKTAFPDSKVNQDTDHPSVQHRAEALVREKAAIEAGWLQRQREHKRRQAELSAPQR